MKTKPTATPWETDPSGMMIGNGERTLMKVMPAWAESHKPEHEANMNFIIKAVNAYEKNQETIGELVQACKLVRRWILSSECRTTFGLSEEFQMLDSALKKAGE